MRRRERRHHNPCVTGAAKRSDSNLVAEGAFRLSREDKIYDSETHDSGRDPSGGVPRTSRNEPKRTCRPHRSGCEGHQPDRERPIRSYRRGSAEAFSNVPNDSRVLAQRAESRRSLGGTPQAAAAPQAARSSHILGYRAVDFVPRRNESDADGGERADRSRSHADQRRPSSDEHEAANPGPMIAERLLPNLP